MFDCGIKRAVNLYRFSKEHRYIHAVVHYEGTNNSQQGVEKLSDLFFFLITFRKLSMISAGLRLSLRCLAVSVKVELKYGTWIIARKPENFSTPWTCTVHN